MTTCSRGGVFYNYLVGLGLEYCANAQMDALIADDTPRSSRSPETQQQRKDLGFSNSGFCYNFEALETIANGLEPGSSKRQGVQEMNDFWLHESTRYKYNQALPEHITEGLGTSGVTALLNSMARPMVKHGGFVHNLKVSKDLFAAENRPKLEALISTYFSRGGMQLMVTALNRNDLENAMREPEKYRNLMVRVAGWTGRFVEQSAYLQKEILSRTFYA